MTTDNHRRERQRLAEQKYYHGPKHDEIRTRINERRKKNGRAKEIAYNKAHPEKGKAWQTRYMSKPGNKEKSKARYKKWWNSPAGLSYRAAQNANRRKPDSKTADRAAYKQWWKSLEGVAYQQARGPNFRADLARTLQRRLLSTKRRAQRNGIMFHDALFWAVLEGTPPTHCESCGDELDYNWKRRSGYHGRAPSIDRIDHTKGYIGGNVAFICQRCNAIKSDATAHELRMIAEYIDRHLGGVENDQDNDQNKHV